MMRVCLRGQRLGKAGFVTWELVSSLGVCPLDPNRECESTSSGMPVPGGVRGVGVGPQPVVRVTTSVGWDSRLVAKQLLLSRQETEPGERFPGDPFKMTLNQGLFRWRDPQAYATPRVCLRDFFVLLRTSRFRGWQSDHCTKLPTIMRAEPHWSAEMKGRDVIYNGGGATGTPLRAGEGGYTHELADQYN